jgi:hypothetical protein
MEGGAQAVVYTNDGQYIGVCSYDMFHFYRGGLARTGFYKFEYFSHEMIVADGETVYLCRYNVIIGKSPGIKVIK